MRLLFFGAGTFGLASLGAISHSSHEITSVVTTPDKPQGRGRRLQPSVVKVWAQDHAIPVLDLETVNSPDSIRFLSEQQADLFCVISYGVILSHAFLNTPPMGCVNVHPSLLPKYRGATPVQEALLQGDATVGTTIMRISEELDSGDILMQASMQLDGSENALQVWRALSELSAPLLVKTLDGLEAKTLQSQPQDHAQATHCKKHTKEEGRLNWQKPAEALHHQVRAFYMWPGSFSVYQGKRIKITKTQYEQQAQSSGGVTPGQVVAIDDRGIGIQAADGVLFVQELQPEGKKPMGYRDFLNGHRVNLGDRLEEEEI
jgi:methionyl-tRNA formyltransferase